VFSLFALKANAQQSSAYWPMFLHDTAHTGVVAVGAENREYADYKDKIG
jgi:hypothetical protein